mmetsp:Transcript_4174/g.26442  ORF Transcript_4174/g.26442 Transcript_4174/m.26442 type:complete len:124 (-) Transcript_4174:20-391(-)
MPRGAREGRGGRNTDGWVVQARGKADSEAMAHANDGSVRKGLTWRRTKQPNADRRDSTKLCVMADAIANDDAKRRAGRTWWTEHGRMGRPGERKGGFGSDGARERRIRAEGFDVETNEAAERR